MTLREKVKERREDILRLAEKWGDTNVRIFGSVARGDERPDSDLDLLIHMDGGTLITLVRFQREISDLMGCKVDVLSDRGLSPYIRDEIINNAVSL